MLHVAAFIGDTEMVKILLANGAHVNAKQDSDGKTPLAMALEKGHAEVASLLRQNGGR